MAGPVNGTGHPVPSSASPPQASRRGVYAKMKWTIVTKAATHKVAT